MGWWGLRSVALQKPPHYATALNPIPAGGAPFLQAVPSMIVILAVPQMKTRVAATIYKGSGECGARIFHSASQRDRGEESMRKGKKGGHKIFWDEGKGGRKEGRGAHSLLRSTCFAALERMTARIRGSENSE